MRTTLVALALALAVPAVCTQPALAQAENRKPVASFTATPNPAGINQTVTFDASSSSDPDGTIALYEWDLDDDRRYDDALGVTASRSFSAAGSYTVRLRVTDASGAKDTATLTVTVTNTPPPPLNQSPAASFTATPNPATTGQTVQFNAGASTDPDGTIASYEWDLDGNGSFETNTGTTPTASQSYASAGTVSVRLRVTDDDGATGLHTVMVVVENRVPVASFTTTPDQPTVGQPVQFNASASSDPDGTIASYAWDLDNDGQFDDATGATASRYFAAAGSYTVRLRVTDNSGATDSASAVVTVQAGPPPPPPPNRLPVASFAASPNPALTGETVQFNAGASSDPDGSIVKYEWDLDGNGSFETNTGTTPTASRAFATAGAVNVGLRVTDTNGATAQKTVSVVIENRVPVASFTASPNPATVGQTVQFNASASTDPEGTIARYDWDLDGDGQFDDASGVGTSHSFTTSGTHTVRLSVTDDRGAKDTATVTVTVTDAANSPPPNAPPPNQLPATSSPATSSPATSAVIPVLPPAGDRPAGTALMSPFPVVRIVGRSTGRGAKIARLEVRGAPRGATVTVRCRGGGCRARQRSTRALSNRLRFRSFERRLRAGTVIRVLVTQSGKLGKYTSFKIRRRRAPLRRDLCVASTEAKPAPCPSS